jgi:3-carboxy-cis,cis-muconate cycloisomerase
MRRSSSPSEGGGNRLFSGVFSRGGAAGCVSDAAWLEAMLDVESALARALARAHLASPDVAAAITTAARDAEFDVARLGAASADTGNPVLALVEALRASVPEGAASTVHQGATSQDVIDTAMMLVAARAGAVVLNDVAAASDAAAALAGRHRGTVMAGRTLLQQAVPVTFGLKAAGWLTSLDAAWTRLAEVVRRPPPVQFGGAAGTLGSLGDRGVDVAALLAEELGLAMPVVPWHSLRLTVFELASALAGIALVLGKIGRDVTLLAQSEVGEVREAGGPGRGASSTMPHKKNPVGAIAILACTRRIPGLLATIAAAGEQEHERAAGAWHAEWETLADLVRLTGSAAAWSRELLEGLEVDAERMRRNLETPGGVPPAQALDPERHLGSTQAWIDRALAAHAALRAREGAAP